MNYQSKFKNLLFYIFLVLFFSCENIHNKELKNQKKEYMKKKEDSIFLQNTKDILRKTDVIKKEDYFIAIANIQNGYLFLKKNPKISNNQPLTLQTKEVFNFLDFYSYPLTEYKDIDTDNINKKEILDLFSLKVDSFIRQEALVLNLVNIEKDEYSALISGEISNEKLFIKYILTGGVGGTHSIIEMRALFPEKVDEEILADVLSSFKAKKPIFYGSQD